MSEKITKHLTIATNEKAKDHIKSAMLARFAEPKKTNRFSVKNMSRPRKAIMALSLASLVFVSSFFGWNISRSPLSSDKVIAAALVAIDKNQSKGQWQYTKTKEETVIDGKTVVTYTEMWAAARMTNENQQGDQQKLQDYRTKTTLDDGRILAEFVTVDGKSYERDTRDVQKEIYGFDPYGGEGAYTPPGFKEAGLDSNALMKLSMKEIDDALRTVKQEPMFAPMFKTTDFPAYSMSPDELMKALPPSAGETEYNALYGGAANMLNNSYTTKADGTVLTGTEAEHYNKEQDKTFQSVESLRTGTIEDKKKALESLKKQGNNKLITNTKWNGKDALGLDISRAYNDTVLGSEILYLDAKSYEVIGEEYSYQNMDSKQEGGTPSSTQVRITYLEQYFTDTKPAFSYEGLKTSEELYNIKSDYYL